MSFGGGGNKMYKKTISTEKSYIAKIFDAILKRNSGMFNSIPQNYLNF
jgi:hypothetical protein